MPRSRGELAFGTVTPVVPARTNTRPEQFGVISPVMFGMPLPDSDDLRISGDKKAMIDQEEWLDLDVDADHCIPVTAHGCD